MTPLRKVFGFYQQHGITESMKHAMRRFREITGVDFVMDELSFLIAGETVTESISDTSVSFYVKNKTEFKRVRSLMGESNVINNIINEINSDDTFFDIGANIGVYSLFVAKGSKANVVAFEPHPANVRRFEENSTLNEIHPDIYECALWDENKALELRLGKNELPGEGKHSLTHGNENKSAKVSAQIGDYFIRQESVPFPNIIKIDVEGAEQHVLSGLQQTISDDRCRTVFCEVHPEKMDSDIEDVRSFLSSAGFNISRLIGEPEGYGLLKATKPSKSE